MIDLTNKVALVTGGSRGIGAAICQQLAHAGASISLTYASDKRSAERCATNVRAAGRKCIITKTAVSLSQNVNSVVRNTLKEFGRIDILVNNAGVWKAGEIGKMTEQQWDETLDINLKGTFLFCNAIAPVMRKQRWGRIINIASTAGQRGEARYSHYAASKAGMIAFTKSVAVELAPFNINANCIAPGWVDTDMTADALRGVRRKRIESGIPRGKVATPDDIAGAALFLASNLADHIIGTTISVNGGGVLI
ncbi:MAG: 3-oxoacyl-ACP reductase FabG [Ignavibacteriales bacterium]|nr:3-oxoacyl-ACP reductase FabG [Ignavibacteriales bacterium]